MRVFEGLGAASLTPAHQREFKHVSAEVRREHLDDAQVHVQRLKPRPGEGSQQEVVQEEGGAGAQPRGRIRGQPAVEQEDQVEEEEGHAQLHQDLGWNVLQQLSAQSSWLFSQRTLVMRFHVREDTYSNERYVSNVAARKTADIPQPMLVMKVRICACWWSVIPCLDRSCIHAHTQSSSPIITDHH